MNPTVAHLAESGSRAGLRPGTALVRKLVQSRLRDLEHGSLTVEENGTRAVFGRSRPGEIDGLVRIQDPSFWSSVAFGGSIGAGESFMARAWETDDLTALLRLMLRNRTVLDGLEGGAARFSAPLRRLFHLRRSNSRRGSRRNITAHYDLGNDLFALFLDRRMLYSSAVFPHPDATLEEAQEAKMERLCRKLDLRPEHHLLEIGTGWGAMAIWAASRYGCRVTTTTISPSQLELARTRVREAGLADRVEVVARDYRDLVGTYDRLVSVEMIEAVGHERIPEFFARCAGLLSPDGVMALQAITIADRHYERARRSVDFIQRYVFPGGAIPSVGSLVAAAAAADLRAVHLEDFGPHYAETLRRWRDRFREQRGPIRGLGYTETFERLWEFYLAYCEAGFEEQDLGVVQVLLARPGWRGHAPLGDLTAGGAS